MRTDLLVGFVLAVTPICLTPGASFTLVTQRVLAGSRREGLLVAAGTATGLCVHAGLAAIGLSALVMRSAEAFTVVRLAGAAYLVWLGVSALRVYLTLAPQFLDPARPVAAQIAVLAAAHVVVAVAWLTVWTMTVSAARQTIALPQFKAIMTRITGTVMIALGVRTAIA